MHKGGDTERLAGSGRVVREEPGPPDFRHFVGIQEENGLERRWRDLQASITHICNIPETIYYAWGAQPFGADVPPGTMY